MLLMNALQKYQNYQKEQKKKTTLNNNIQKSYIKNIKKQLKISSKYKRTLLNDLEINIDSYISEHPNTTYKDLVENFGTPEDVSESF